MSAFTARDLDGLANSPRTSMAGIELRYADSDHDVVTIHRFLCVVAAPYLPGPIDPKKSIEEVWRVCRDDVAVIAMRGEEMVGTIGLTCPDYWWGHGKFLVNRWLFALPGSGAWRVLLKEARDIARASELECLILSEHRHRVSILNKKVRGVPHVLREPGREDPNLVAAPMAADGGGRQH